MAVLLSLLMLLAFLLPSPGQAAVDCADPNAVADTFGTPASPMVLDYTRRSGSDLYGFAFAAHRNGATQRTVSSISLGASTPTSLTTAQFQDPSGGHLFGVASPPSGTNTLTVGWSGVRLADGAALLTCTGVDQVSPTHDATQSLGTGTTASVTVSNVAATDSVLFCISKDGTSDITGGGSAVAIAHDNGSPEEMDVGCWYQPGSAGGSVSATLGSSEQWTIHAVAIKQSVQVDNLGDAVWF